MPSWNQSPYRPEVPAGLEWNELDSYYRSATWEARTFAVVSLPVQLVAILVLGVTSLFQGCLLPILLGPLALAGAILLAAGIGPSWLAIAMTGVAAYLLIGPVVGSVMHDFMGLASRAASAARVLRPPMFVLLLPLQLVTHFILGTISAPSYEDKVNKARKQAAIEIYPLTHVWLPQRLEAMQELILNTDEPTIADSDT